MGDIPIIACVEEDYIGPKKAYLTKDPVAAAERVPIASLAGRYNLVMMRSELYLRENIKLIRRLVPGMKKFIFIGDGRQINSANDDAIREILRTHYRDVEYQFLSAKNISTNQLLDSLSFIDPETTGVLFSSWIYKHTFAGNTSLVTSGYKLIGTSAAPLFALKLIEFMDDKEGMVGGYAYDQQHYNRVLISKIAAILQGKQARELSFYIPADAAPVINYNVLLRKGLSPSLCPPGTLFLNKPPTFWERNGRILLGASFFIVLLTLLFLYCLRNVNMVRAAQRKEIMAMTDYKDLISNMPVLYMQQEIVTDGEGMLVDTVYRKVNAYFEKDFFPKEEVIDKKSSEIFPESMLEFLQFIRIALKEKRAITFSWYFKRVDRFYDTVITGTRESGVIDVFCIDSTELHKVQQKLSTTNSKLAMALDVTNIVPWKWDLVNHTILCDVNRPIELSVHGESVNEEQLMVPDEQYFSKIFKEDRARVEEAYRNLIEGRSDKVKEEYRVVTLQRGLHKVDWVEAQAAVETRGEDGRPLTLVESSLVITNRKKWNWNWCRPRTVRRSPTA